MNSPSNNVADTTESAESAERRLHGLISLTRRLSEPFTLEEAMPLVVRQVLQVLDLDRGVLLLDAAAGGYETVVTRAHDAQDNYTNEDKVATRSMFEEVKRTRRPVVTLLNGPDGYNEGGTEGDNQGDNQGDKKGENEGGKDGSFWSVGSVIGLPLLDRSRFFGVLCLDTAGEPVKLVGEHLAYFEAIAAVTALAITNARAYSTLLEAERISEDLGTLNVDQVLERVLLRIVELTGAERGCVLMRSEEGLEVRASCDREGRQPASGTAQRFPSLQFIESVAITGEAVVSDSVGELVELGDEGDSGIQFGLTSKLCVPIRARDAVLGVVYLENRLAQGVFTEEEKRLVQLVADRTGAAIENAKVYNQEHEILCALANAVEERDFSTNSHVQRLAQDAVAVGIRLGLSSEELRELEQSALLHDIGKIGILDQVLLKEGKLTDEEWYLMREHPVVGAGIAGPVKLPQAVLDGILYHQEAWDGSGYPYGLAGEDIPLFGRIIAVVDAFDTMTTEQPYRHGRSLKAAAAELNRCAGKQFDPDIVLAFLTVLYEEDKPA